MASTIVDPSIIFVMSFLELTEPIERVFGAFSALDGPRRIDARLLLLMLRSALTHRGTFLLPFVFVKCFQHLHQLSNLFQSDNKNHFTHSVQPIKLLA